MDQMQDRAYRPTPPGAGTLSAGSSKEESLRNLLLSAHSRLDRITALGNVIENATIGSSVIPPAPANGPAQSNPPPTHGLFVAKALDMRLEELERFFGNIADRL